MLGAENIQVLRSCIEESLSDQEFLKYRAERHIACLVIAHPEDSFVKREMLPVITEADKISWDRIDFVVGGFKMHLDKDIKEQNLDISSDVRNSDSVWVFDPNGYQEFLNWLQNFGFRYNGGVDFFFIEVSSNGELVLRQDKVLHFHVDEDTFLNEKVFQFGDNTLNWSVRGEYLEGVQKKQQEWLNKQKESYEGEKIKSLIELYRFFVVQALLLPLPPNNPLSDFHNKVKIFSEDFKILTYGGNR